MVKCSRCGAQTILHVNGVPVCAECDRKFSEELSAPRPANAGSEKGPESPTPARGRALGTEAYRVSSR
jgi:hypothetical protein